MNHNHITPGAPQRHARRRMALADWFGLACLILLVVCSVILYVRLLSTAMLTEGLLKLLVAGLIVLNVLVLIALLPRWRNKIPKLVAGVLSLIICGGMLYAVSAADTVQNALMNISGKMSEQEITYIMVLKDDKAVEISDALGYNFGSLTQSDVANTTALLEAVKSGLGEMENTTYDSIAELVDALYAGEVDAIMLNEGYIGLLENMEEYSTFSDDTRTIYEFAFEKELEPIAPNPLITREPFVVYCSGIDSRTTNINIRSLSDVNIMAVVNPETRQVLLLNTPRDYYVPLVSPPYAGKMDKLTHAGALGIEESMKVLAQLYGVEGDYYMRVNFSGLIDIVDALGGVDVVSPKKFKTIAMTIPGYGKKSYSFEAGEIHLTGAEAVAFSRERKAFGDGDNQRGKNQMAVIKGIVDKATSPQILSKYDELLKAVEGCFITNMPYEDISALVKMQLKDMRSWNITTYAVSGTGDMQECASMPGWNLWVMQPNQKQVATAKAMVQQVLNGEVPTLP